MSVSYYDEHATRYFAETVLVDMAGIRERFEHYFPLHAQDILDAGCGSGRDAKAFAESGYRVSAFDASEKLTKLASEWAGIPVRHLRFQEFEQHWSFDGIWACSSLVHVPLDELDEVFGRLTRALRPQGVMYLNFKKGHGEREQDGRTFTDLMPAEVCALVARQPDMELFELWVTGSLIAGNKDRWINVIARKKEAADV